MTRKLSLLRDTRGANLVEYIILVGVIALIAIAGWVIFRQPLDAAKLTGMSLIVAGIVVMNLSSI